MSTKYIYIHIYLHLYVYIKRERERERVRERDSAREASRPQGGPVEARELFRGVLQLTTSTLNLKPQTIITYPQTQNLKAQSSKPIPQTPAPLPTPQSLNPEHQISDQYSATRSQRARFQITTGEVHTLLRHKTC